MAGKKRAVPRTCSNCPDKPHKARGLCASCYDKWLKKANPDYAERQRLSTERWVRDNYPRVRDYHQKYALQDRTPQAQRHRRNALAAFGLTEQDYDRLYSKQEGKCAICGEEMKRLSIDHDHTTGVIRGLLCRPCNLGLGMLKDSIEGVRAALDYLVRSSGEGPK